jgi:hypothetical protein
LTAFTEERWSIYYGEKWGIPVALFDLARDGMGIPLGAFSPVYLGKAPFPFLFAPLSTSAFLMIFQGK